MGSLFGGGSTTTTQNTNSSPWSAQQPYLLNGLQQASNIENQRMAAGPYSGDYYAGSNPTQSSAIANAAGWANSTGNMIPGGLASYGTNLLEGAAPSYLSNASNIASNGAGGGALSGILNGYATGGLQASSTDPALSGALNNAAINGANSLNGFTQGQQQVMNQSLADPTQGLINSANQYMNSSGVQDAVNNVNSQINQQLNESTVPQLNRAAAMGGALNSSRAGMAEAMANENAAIATGNADSQIQNNAWNTGLSTAAAERNAGLTTGLGAANSGLLGNAGLASGQQASQLGQSEFNTNTALGAAGTGLNFDLGNTSAMLNANGQLGNAIGLGMNGLTSANQNAALNFALGSGAGTYQQQANQSDLNNEYAKWQGNNTYGQGVLNNYWGIVSPQLGSQGQNTATTQNSGSTLGGLLGLGLGGAALLGSGGIMGAGADGIFNGGVGGLGGSLGGLFGANGLSGIAGCSATIRMVVTVNQDGDRRC